MKFKFVLAVAAVCIMAQGLKAQTVSLATSTPAEWVKVQVGLVPTATNVTIRANDTITLDQNVLAKNITIEAGATLNSTLTASADQVFALQMGPGDSTSIKNNGMFGSLTGANDGISVQVTPTTRYFELTGQLGTSSIGNLVPSAANVSLVMELNQNLLMNQKGSPSLAPYYASVTTPGSSNVTYLIDKGITMKVNNPQGGLSLTGNTPGHYTYTINGTLDLSNSTGGNYLNGSASLDVNGLLKLGSGINIQSGGTKIDFNINNGGLVDATKTTTMNMGDSYFTTRGTGALMRQVGGDSDVAFPVAASGSGSVNTINIRNTGVTGNFKVTAQDAANYSMDEDSKAINKQWLITPDANTRNFTLAVTPSWTSVDEVAKLENADIKVAKLENYSWETTDALLKGNGFKSAPYTASAGGYSTGGVFTITKKSGAFAVYPNPAVSQVTVTHPVAEAGAHIKIVTLYGKVLFEGSVAQGAKNTPLNVSALDKGLYVVQFENGGKKFTTKVIRN